MGLDRLKIGTRLIVAFGAIALLVAVLMAVASSGIGRADDAYRAAVGAATGLTAEQRAPLELAIRSGHGHLESVRLWVLLLGAGVFVVSLVAFVLLRNGIVAPLKQAILIAETVASGDLSQEFSSDLEGDFGRLLTALGTMEDTLTELVSGIKQSTDSITEAAADIDSGNSDLARRTEDQVSSLADTAGSMAELTSTVRENAERASSASSLAVNA